METLTEFFGTYGYWVFFGLGFAEFAGAPIASTPFLIAGGAIAAAGGVNFALVVGAAALGGLLADAVWYGLARWRGAGLVDSACGLTSNPAACVFAVEHRVRQSGNRYVFFAKFIPGAGNLIAPAAGLAGMRTLPFVARNAVALLLWAGAYVTLGWIFAGQIEAVIRAVAASSRIALIAAVGLVLAFGVWRVVKVMRHRSHHAAPATGEAPGTPAQGAVS